VPEIQIVVTPHWGGEGEYTPYPSPTQRTLARNWISGGADGVIGHHSHTIQSVEYFEGKPIFYSIGNFHFPHEESALYPLTRFGLGIDFADEKVQNTIIFEHSGAKTTIVEDHSKIAYINKYIEDISNDLVAKDWTLWRWARAVGRLYTDKNAASWKLRFHRNFFPTLVRWLVVQMMPKTLLLRLGKFFETSDTRRRYEAFDNIP
jgi:hypothetical protein